MRASQLAYLPGDSGSLHIIVLLCGNLDLFAGQSTATFLAEEDGLAGSTSECIAAARQAAPFRGRVDHGLTTSAARPV